MAEKKDLMVLKQVQRCFLNDMNEEEEIPGCFLNDLKVKEQVPGCFLSIPGL